ncbi:hypothetical protein SAMN05192549_10493 [Duganella sacchari]|uniref:Polar amino acid transport system substrate-binding protein n=1 Tax=Duganella sacchari TaxID=551987 RepID=A0A1M7NPL0_9BURK|nr:hypothetical protein [Duganella sacchari]SHN05796.1 hypothetical protein SAMN05192549_10493 [Duganella sacchari]
MKLIAGVVFMSMLCLAPGYSVASGCPKAVRVALPNFPVPPLIYGTTEVEEPPGSMVIWARSALSSGDCKPLISIRRLPVKRLLAELKANTVDVAPGFAPTSPNLAVLVFPRRGKELDVSLIIIHDRLSLYVRADDLATKWNGKHLNIAQPRIGISAGIAATKVEAEKRGWLVDEAGNPQSNLAKLKAHRIDAILEPDVWFETYLNTVPEQRASIRKLEPQVSSIDRYAPVSIGFYGSYPEYTRQFWQAMRRQSTAAN